MRSMPIVSMQPDGKFSGTMIGVGVGNGVGPFSERCLNEALCLAISPGRVGLCADMFKAEFVASPGEGF